MKKQTATPTSAQIDRQIDQIFAEMPAGKKQFKTVPVNKADEFPLVSTFSRQDMDRAIELMQDDIIYQEQAAATAAARAEIKTELAQIAERYGVPGMRWGQLAVYYRGNKVKRTLSKTLLVENGVTIEQINDSYKESEPYVDLRVTDLSKSKDKPDWRDEED